MASRVEIYLHMHSEPHSVKVKAYPTAVASLFITPFLLGPERKLLRGRYAVTHKPTGLKMPTLELSRVQAEKLVELCIASGIPWDKITSPEQIEKVKTWQRKCWRMMKQFAAWNEKMRKSRGVR